MPRISRMGKRKQNKNNNFFQIKNERTLENHKVYEVNHVFQAKQPSIYSHVPKFGQSFNLNIC